MNSVVSVVIPVFNGAKYIREALNSVINQTYKNLEIVVVDDGSTDDTAQIINEFNNIKYIYKAHSGTAASLNEGLRNVTGEYISFLDADDYWTLDKLEFQLNFLAQNPEIDVVFGMHKRFYQKLDNELTDDEREDSNRILPAYFKASLLARKEAFFNVGFFNESIVVGDFLDWYRRAEDMGIKMQLTNHLDFHRRIHGENSTILHREKIQNYTRIMKESMDRRRKMKREENSTDEN